ncbi:MAG: hypothetical protein M1834_008774 [Cirrosporium novae-zelandiae]|nr:MAG: hypothetical protein M1834_008774 [Cirrosporium novae-zelandiae]
MDSKFEKEVTTVQTDSEENTGTIHQITTSRDIGAELYAEIDELSPEELQAERALVLKKLDWRIMPIIMVTYTLQFLDKLSLNYASAYSLKDDLNLVGQRYSWVAAIFNFGYMFWAIPGNLMVQRLPVAKYVGGMLITWSILLVAHVGLENYAGILILRFMLGMFEAAISPACMAIMSMFYRRSEQPLRMCLMLGCNGMASMWGALLGYGLGHVKNSSLAPWKLIFLVIGLMNFSWGWVFLWFMPDSPTSAKFLNHKQRVVAVDRVAENMIGVKTKGYKLSQAREAALDFKVLCLTLSGLACGVLNGGVSNFGSALIKGFGFGGIDATLYQMPNGALEFIFVPLFGLAATYIKDSRLIMIAISCIPPLSGLIGIRFTPLSHKWSLVACTWFQGILGAPVILSWNLLTSNIAGHTKRSIANGLWFAIYAGGNVAGASIFFSWEAPRYFSAIVGLCICYGAVIAIAIILRLYLQWENRRRDKRFGVVERTADGADEEAMRNGFKDMTDMESKHFRYCL